jgi:carbonic anhydrase/acetyltransferase-like protein (isoleucine patch superfamily)
MTRKRHINPDGSVGGEVDDTAHVDPSVYLGPNCVVRNRAQVLGDVRLEGDVCVWDDVVIDGRNEGDIVIRGYVAVYGKVHVSGFVRLINDDLYERLWLRGDVKVCGYARINGPGAYDSGTIEGSFEDMLDYFAETT